MLHSQTNRWFTTSVIYVFNIIFKFISTSETTCPSSSIRWSFLLNELKQWTESLSYKMICIFIGVSVFDDDSFNPIVFPWHDFVQHFILTCTAKWTFIFGEYDFIFYKSLYFHHCGIKWVVISVLEHGMLTMIQSHVSKIFLFWALIFWGFPIIFIDPTGLLILLQPNFNLFGVIKSIFSKSLCSLLLEVDHWWCWMFQQQLFSIVKLEIFNLRLFWMYHKYQPDLDRM